MIDLRQLKTFIAVAKEGSLTRASEAVFLSPPAVSGQIKALEESLGLALFERTARGMHLTPAGRVLLEEANLALNAADQVAARAQFLKSGIQGDCRIGTVSEPAILHLGEFMTFLMGRHPGLQLSFTQGISGEIIDRILQGTLDAGYVIGEILEPQLESVLLKPVTLRVVGPSSWAERLVDAAWEDLISFPWVSTPKKCSFHQIADRMFRRHGLMPKTIIEADQESTLQKLVADGMGLTLLREDVALAGVALGELVIWERGSEASQLCFVYPKASTTHYKIAAMLEAVEEVWKLPAPLPET